jgi:hypothetical protein
MALKGAPRWLMWIILVSMLLLLLSQVLSGFDRPVEIALGCMAAGLAVIAAASLVASRKDGRVRQ